MREKERGWHIRRIKQSSWCSHIRETVTSTKKSFVPEMCHDEAFEISLDIHIFDQSTYQSLSIQSSGNSQ